MDLLADMYDKWPSEPWGFLCWVVPWAQAISIIMRAMKAITWSCECRGNGVVLSLAPSWAPSMKQTDVKNVSFHTDTMQRRSSFHVQIEIPQRAHKNRKRRRDLVLITIQSSCLNLIETKKGMWNEVSHAKNIKTRNTFATGSWLVSVENTTVMQFSWAECTAVVFNICLMQLLHR